MLRLIPDLAFALRTMARSPHFSIVAILSLALGIGANTAIFTLTDQIMLRQLPVRDPGRLVMLWQEGPHNGSNMGARMHSYPMYQDFQKRGEPFSEVLCRRLLSASLSVGEQTERVSAELVSGNYFSMLGVSAAAGRVFNSREDDTSYNGHPVVVLSHDYWRTRFAGDPRVVGQKIRVNNYPMTIVGVSAAGFAGLDPARSPQIRVPVQMKPVLAPEWTWVHMDDRRTRWVQVFARLKPGYTAESALGPMSGLFRSIREYETTLPAAAKWSPYAKQRFLEGKIRIAPAATGYSSIRNDFSRALVVLMCMVGLVLLIACANVANLLIARAFARQKEIAVRLSIGASRGQLVRQLLVESMVLAITGGAAGILVAYWMTRGLLALAPAQGNPLLIRPEPDARILLFTLGLTMLTGLLFGLLPALRASRPNLAGTLKDAAAAVTGPGSGTLLRKGLVAAQVALSFLLMFGAGLFVRSLQNLQAAETGFRDIHNLVSFGISPALNGYDPERAARLYRDLLERVRATPGIRDAGFASVALLAGDEWDNSTMVEGHQPKDGEDMQAFMNSLSPGYFKTMGVRMVEGRDFEWRDFRVLGPREQPAVAIVNEKFARHFFKDRSPIGRRIGFGGSPQTTQLAIEIIGVVEDSLYEGPREGVRRQVFVPHSGNFGVTFYARAGMDSKAAYSTLRAAVKELDASLPVYEMKTLGGQLDETLLTERLIAMLSAGFGLLATLLAAIGLYGVMAFMVARRTKEMGVRMALGAQPSESLWLVMREVFLLMGIGLLVGAPTALALGRLVSTQLYGLEPHDPWIAGVTLVVVITVSSLAGLVPAHRASRIDPLLALRYE